MAARLAVKDAELAGKEEVIGEKDREIARVRMLAFPGVEEYDVDEEVTQPLTMNPQPCILNPKPETSNPQPSTLNPKP